METNRDLYLAVSALAFRQKSTTRSLEKYLRALLLLAEPYARQYRLSLGEFYDLLAAAFEADPPAFDESWRNNQSVPKSPGWPSMLALKMKLPFFTARQDGEPPQDPASGYLEWKSTLISQIVDLREMHEAGISRNELRYFGIDSPRGSRWYNFDPATYIECGVVGSFGGWEPGDPDGRQLVPGRVAVMTPDGKIESRDPKDVESPVYAVPGVDWDTFKEFILCGQTYE